MMTKENAISTTTRASYHLTKHNALKHGISSNVDVLPWENAEDLEKLNLEFFEDFNPQGATEVQLVLDLAMLTFRKQRIYKAENAAIVHKLSYVSTCSLKNDVNLLCEDVDVEEIGIDIKAALYHDSSQDTKDIEFYEKTIDLCQAVIDNSSIEISEAFNTLPQSVQDHWKARDEEKEKDEDYVFYSPNIKGLKTFLQEQIIDHSMAMINTMKSRKSIKEQAIGMAYFPGEYTDKILKYETAIHRTFDKKLAMLFKLREFRRAQPLVIQA